MMMKSARCAKNPDEKDAANAPFLVILIAAIRTIQGVSTAETKRIKPMNKIACLTAVIIMATGIAYAMVYHWTNRDASTICEFLKYNRSTVDHGTPPIGYCVIDWVDGGQSRVSVRDAYADYVRQLRRQRAVMGGAK
jgi:hypothetical protein